MNTIEQNAEAHIYICAEVPFNNKVKIGRTGQTAVRRLQAIQVGNPNKLEMRFISHPIPFHKIYENNLKIAYKGKHLQGEWYEMEEWEVDALTDNLLEDEELLNDDIEDDAVKHLLDGVKKYGDNI